MSDELSRDERAELEALRNEKSKTGKKGLYLQVSQKGAGFADTVWGDRGTQG